MRFLTIAVGALSILVAIWCFANQGAVFVSVAFIIGIMMIMAGLCEIRSYFDVHRHMDHASFILTEGACDVVLGALVLANCVQTEAAVPIFFGMWVLFSGAMRAATALNSSIKKSGDSYYMLAVGCVSMAVGIYSFLNTMLLGIPNVCLISVCFLIKGVNMIATGVEMMKRRQSPRKDENEAMDTTDTKEGAADEEPEQDVTEVLDKS